MTIIYLVDNGLREEQAGFRPKRSSRAEQIFTLRRIIEKSQEFQVPLAVSFIDFSKAFDSIHRPSLWGILLSYGIPERIVKAIGNIYDNSRCRVRNADGLSDWLQVLTGVHKTRFPELTIRKTRWPLFPFPCPGNKLFNFRATLKSQISVITSYGYPTRVCRCKFEPRQCFTLAVIDDFWSNYDVTFAPKKL